MVTMRGLLLIITVTVVYVQQSGYRGAGGRRPSEPESGVSHLIAASDI